MPRHAALNTNLDLRPKISWISPGKTGNVRRSALTGILSGATAISAAKTNYQREPNRKSSHLYEVEGKFFARNNSGVMCPVLSCPVLGIAEQAVDQRRERAV